ncbi:MAG: hypothetical protein IJT18_03205 [Oscillospiraceae bacterium]|nr:hypothetical protein [Oscillospiraceae bacterium]
MCRNQRRARCITFPAFVENACCNPCCEDTGVQAVRVDAAAENTCGCCCCCGCCGGCGNCGNCGNVAGASNCNCRSVGGASTGGCRPRPPVWGDVGGIGDFSPFPCPCRDVLSTVVEK